MRAETAQLETALCAVEAAAAGGLTMPELAGLAERAAPPEAAGEVAAAGRRAALVVRAATDR